MVDIYEIIKSMPNMKSGSDLISALSVFPQYNDGVRSESQSIRLMTLQDLYQIYIPSQMSVEIYSKFYLAMLRSLQKKCTKIAVQQQYQNHNCIKGMEYSGIMGGSDSFTIIGTSGIGKSSAINRVISLISENNIITIPKPYTKIIPCVVVQCPFDSSVKGLLLEILRRVDEFLDSNYYTNAVRARATTDMLVGSVSQVAINHIGLLVVDEIQNVVNSKNGKSLVGALTQLINNSGISIGMIGTPECEVFFESALQLARRSVGLHYGAMSYDNYFQSFCMALFDYQYVQNKSKLTIAITEWLYEHSAGITSVVVSLIHDAQEIAILTGKETLDLDTLNVAYEQRMSMLHCYIQPSIKKGKSITNTKINENIISEREKENENKVSILSLVERSKSKGTDIVQLLKEHFPLVEVTI